jgi:hypothetical protein
MFFHFQDTIVKMQTWNQFIFFFIKWKGLEFLYSNCSHTAQNHFFPSSEEAWRFCFLTVHTLPKIVFAQQVKRLGVLCFYFLFTQQFIIPSTNSFQLPLISVKGFTSTFDQLSVFSPFFSIILLRIYWASCGEGISVFFLFFCMILFRNLWINI